MICGNETLLRQVNAMLSRGALPQCVLLAGPEGAGKSQLAGYLAMALQCRAPRGGQPCGQCAECRRVEGRVHPDVIAVDSDKQTIPVETVRQVRADAFVLPNQGRHKVYHFPRADALGEPAQNALLKLIEEPPEYGVFLLESRNPDLLLPTVRSRATELRLQPLSPTLLERELAARRPQASQADREAAARRSEGWLGQALALLDSGGASCPEAEAIVRALCQTGRRAALLRACIPLEKRRRDELQPVLEQLRQMLAAALACRKGAGSQQRPLAEALTARSLSLAANAAQTALEGLQANVGPAHVMGALAVQLAEI